MLVDFTDDIDVPGGSCSVNPESLSYIGIIAKPELVVTGHVLRIVVELTELLELILLGLIGQVRGVCHNVDVIVAGLVQNKLCLRDQHVWPLEERQDLDLVLIDGLHQLLLPKPDVIVLVHEEEALLRDFLFDLRDSLRVILLEIGHYSGHVFLIFRVEKQWLNLH